MPNLKKADVGAPNAFGSESDTQLHLSPTLGLADGSHAEIPSPARVLQQRLLDDLNTEAGEDDGRRWAPRTTLLVASGVSLALWGAIALAIATFH